MIYLAAVLMGCCSISHIDYKLLEVYFDEFEDEYILELLSNYAKTR